MNDKNLQPNQNSQNEASNQRLTNAANNHNASPSPQQGNTPTSSMQPVGSFNDSLKQDAKKKDKKNLKDKALDLGSKVNPALRAAKKLNDVKSHLNDRALDNIRAKKGPQRPPGTASNDKVDANSKEKKESRPSEFGKEKKDPSKPSFLDDKEDDEELEEEQEEQSGLSLLGVGGQNKKASKRTDMLASLKGMAQKKLLLGIILGAVAGFLLLLFIFVMVVNIFSRFNPMLAISEKLDLERGGITYDITDKDEEAWTSRIKDVVDSYTADGKNVNAQAIAAVFYIHNNYDSKYTYKKMSTSDIREIADMMLDGNSYSESTFKDNLQNNYFPKHFKNLSEQVYKKMTNEVFEYFSDYEDFIEKESSSSQATTNGSGSCTYEIKGMNLASGGNYKILTEKFTVSNLKVRLFQAGDAPGSYHCGGTYGKEIPGEELVDFEKYILGVAYAEVGDGASEHEFKTQMIAARGYALTRAAVMGNSQARKLYQENGQWILQIMNCVADQVYCDPDRGCSKYVPEGDQNGNVYSGTTTATYKYKDPLPEDAPQRKWAQETAGQMPLDKNGYVYYTDFAQDEQDIMDNLADNHLEYTNIVLRIFPEVKSLSQGNCTNLTTGSYTSWKQTDPAWKDVVLGPSGNSDASMGSIGCLITSISVLMQKSGVLEMPGGTTALLDSKKFNPGEMAKALNKVNAFTNNGVLISYNKVTQVAPRFVYKNLPDKVLKGLSKTEKLNRIRNYVNNGYYCAVRVIENDGQHWVAVDSVDLETVRMIDPSKDQTDMFQEYGWKEPSRMECFKVE